MNQQREAEKKKVTVFGMTTVIIPLIVVIVLVVGWFIFASPNSMPPEAPPDAQVTAPQ